MTDPLADTDPSDLTPDRDARAEMPTRHPCPLCEWTKPIPNMPEMTVSALPHPECWLCGGAGVTGETYKAWVLAGRPKVKPEGWT